MDLIRDLLAEHGADLVSQVTGQTPLDREQAEVLVPAAAEQTVGQLQSFDAGALGGLLGGGGLSSLAEKIDAEALAARTGLPPELVRKGLDVLVPKLLELIGARAGGSEGLGSLLGGDSPAGGVLGGLGKLLGR